MTASKIEWTDRSDWNPIRGCTRVSPGCGGPGDAGGCYAEAMAARFSDPGQWGHGYAERTAKGGRWTSKVEIQWDRIDLPLRWRKPAKIFASSTSDFFHKDLLWHDVARLFGVMIAAHHLHGHTLQVLTKRADIMRERLNDLEFWEIANAEAGMHVMERVDPLNRRSDDARATLDDYGPDNPPPGIWLGVSVEDQTRADERIPDLLDTPAAVRFISAEPLLGQVDISSFTNAEPGNVGTQGDAPCSDDCGAVTSGQAGSRSFVERLLPRLDWVIVGGESGPKARPMHPDWARSLRDQCAAVGTAFHFKQWGEWRMADSALGDPPAVRNRDFWRVGKKAAGRLLDGVEHNGMPEVRV